MHGVHHEGTQSGDEESRQSSGKGQSEVGQEGGEEGKEKSCSGSKDVSKPPEERASQQHGHRKHRLHVAKDYRVCPQLLGEEL